MKVAGAGRRSDQVGGGDISRPGWCTLLLRCRFVVLSWQLDNSTALSRAVVHSGAGRGGRARWCWISQPGALGAAGLPGQDFPISDRRQLRESETVGSPSSRDAMTRRC
jgi:hypothetical protein